MALSLNDWAISQLVILLDQSLKYDSHVTPHVVICKNQQNIPLFQEVNSVTELIIYFTRFSEGWQQGTTGWNTNNSMASSQVWA